MKSLGLYPFDRPNHHRKNKVGPIYWIRSLWLQSFFLSISISCLVFLLPNFSYIKSGKLHWKQQTQPKLHSFLILYCYVHYYHLQYINGHKEQSVEESNKYCQQIKLPSPLRQFRWVANLHHIWLVRNAVWKGQQVLLCLWYVL